MYPEVWTWLKAVNPAWVSAIAAVAGLGVAIGLIVRWYLLRRDLRGSGAAIIALLGEAHHTAHEFQSTGYADRIRRSDRTVYFAVGTDSYLLCRRDLERLHASGYVYRDQHKYHLSRLGRLLLERHDDARLLAKGVARAKRGRYFRCAGGLWLRCRCVKYWIDGHERIRVPFPLGRWWTDRAWVRRAGIQLNDNQDQ